MIDHMGQQPLEDHVLGTDASGSAGLDRSHQQQLYAVDLLGEHIRQIIHLGVDLEIPLELVGLGALLDQRLHFGDRGDL